MSDQERIQECLRKEIRSLLISAKDGLTPQQLEKEYLLMVGSHLPLRILGYRSTMELVLDMPDVVSICPGGDGTVILKAIPDESTKGIASLVAKQRSSHKAFAKRFGRSFQYMQYGFLSMFEVLNAASDVISVEQTRAGSLLMLKKSTSEEKPRGWPVEGKIFTQPFRMKQEGSTPPGFPGAKARFSRPSVNMEPAKQVLNVRKTPEASGAEMSRLNDTEKLNQLENTFKSVIAQIGPGGTINPELKHKIKFVVSKFPEGLLISKLLREFEVVFKEQLSPKKLGFLNVIELVGALSDILYVEFREAEQDLLLFDADLRPLPRDGAVSSVRNTCLVQSDKKIEAKACVSSPPRNASSSAAAQRENTWAWSFKHHKEPEQKSYKKPNLVVKPLQLQLEMDKSQLNMAAASHDIPPDSVRDRKLCRLPPLDTSTLVGVFVEYVISPSQFYIRIYSRDSSELLEDMMIEMRRCYSNQLVSDRYVMPEHFIRPGHLCCVRISEDKWWYRVVIHRVLGKQEVEVFYPDFGNIGTVQKSSLRFLKCCYTKLPAQAIPCSLAWVRPTEGYWTSTAVLQFQKLCGLKPLVGVVDEYIDGILNIFLCDTSSNEDVYFHHVLRAEGHAIVCRENVPSKGFSELNPLALYTKSSGGPEDAVLTERVCPSQHHYFKEVQEISPQSKESDLYTLDINDEKAVIDLKYESEKPLKDSEFSSLKAQDKSWKEGAKRSVPELKGLKGETEDEIPTGMPCLESVTIGDDVWDENWLPVHAKMGPGGDAAPHLLTSSRGGEKPYRSREETPEKDWCFSTQDVWDDSCQPLGLENGTQVKVQEPEGRGAQEKSAGAPRVPKQSHLEGSSDPSALPELEEFYVSLVQSQQPAAAGSQGEPPGAQRQPGPVPRSAAALDAAPPAVGPPERRSGSVESSPESLKNEDLSSSHALTVFTDKSRGAMDQLSLILSPEHQIPQRFYIPRSTATAALGAAARLATSRSFLHWYPSVKGMEA
ncbi:tudor domain-containing protein 5 isoform X3 [Phyllostomus hastatus]|uniref:tudor domain-containing protein 5 isoform X3 n=1 Tax=Phyllostomus hastatus TaxID=9423 RepID=UPI001E68155B|nr:tudor domain-containing protein 5 isoform X3 [Phyllostomus hastatus]